MRRTPAHEIAGSRMRGRMRGSALILVVVLAALALVVIAMTTTQTIAATHYAGQAAREPRVRYACEAALAYYRDQIAYPQYAGQPFPGWSGSPPPFTGGTPPGYIGNANQWLRTLAGGNNYWRPLFPPRVSSSTLPQPSLIFGGSNVPPFEPGIPVWVWLNDVCLDANGNPLPAASCVAGDDYRLAAYAELPVSGRGDQSSRMSGDRMLIVQDFRESQPFSSYMFFTFSQDLYVGNVTVAGSIHSNRRIIFPTSGNATVTGKATAVGGFQNYPSNPNVSLGSAASGGSAVPLPSTGVSQTDSIAVAGAGSTAAAPGPKFYSVKKGTGQFTGWNALSGPNVNATITIKNGSPPVFDITANGSTGGTVTYSDVAFPDKGVIYVDGNVSLNVPDGFSGKLTVVAGNGDLTVNTNVQYKDPNPSAPTTGQYAYNLVDPATGNVLDPATTSGSWDGYQYQPNSSYSGPPTSLGLMAKNSVKSSATSPNNMIVNASIYANNGSPFDAVSAGVAKNNLAIGGSLVGTATGARTNTLVGYNDAGLYAFDQKASKSPPPGWLSTPAPAFGAIYRRSGAVAPASFIHQGANTTAGGAGQ